MGQSLSLQPQSEPVIDRPTARSTSSPFVFADRWLKSLPGRWARNGGVFGAIFSYAQVGGSGSWEELLNNGYELSRFVFLFALLTVSSGGISFLLGLWARRVLSRSRDGDWGSVVKSVPWKWIAGANILGLLTLLADVIFEWRGPIFQSGGSAAAIGSNIGSMVGMLIFWSTLGLVTALISRRGLRRAIADDKLCTLRAQA
jgi:hypothetical protein